MVVRWWQLKCFLISLLLTWGNDPILTSIFFKWKTTQKTMCCCDTHDATRTFSETNSPHLKNGWLEDDSFLFWDALPARCFLLFFFREVLSLCVFFGQSFVGPKTWSHVAPQQYQFMMRFSINARCKSRNREVEIT